VSAASFYKQDTNVRIQKILFDSASHSVNIFILQFSMSEGGDIDSVQKLNSRGSWAKVKS